MKLIAAAVSLLLLAPSGLWAQDPPTKRLNWKPDDFRPLTGLPWLDIEPNDTVKVVERIFREPDLAIRNAVLAAYLREVSLHSFGMAFDRALMLEGTNTPDDLVSLMLGIWGLREPAAAWEKTQALARLVAVEDGWLGYDSWDCARITVQDEGAVRGANHWLQSASSLLSFPKGVENSGLTTQEKVPLLRQFATMWFDRFQRWPGSSTSGGAKEGADLPRSDVLLRRVLTQTTGQARNPEVAPESEAASMVWEITLRRWLAGAPQEAPEIMRHIHHSAGSSPAGDASPALLLLWSQVDAPGMKAWVTHPPPAHPDTVWMAKSILMSKVDDATRKQWLAEVVSSDEKGSRLGVLAGWQPKLAVDEVLREGSSDDVRMVFNGMVYPCWAHHYLWAASHHGLGFLREFDLGRLAPAERSDFVAEYAPILMEQWGDIDAGECARFGLRCVSQVDWVSKNDLCRYFGGKASLADDGILDRTFCSLRVWAVTKPQEMRDWMATVKDAELRQALSWLLDHPWGGFEPPAQK